MANRFTVHVKRSNFADGRFSCRAKGGGWLRRFHYRKEAEKFQKEVEEKKGIAVLLRGPQKELEERNV